MRHVARNFNYPVIYPQFIFVFRYVIKCHVLSRKTSRHLARPFTTFGVIASDFAIRKKIKEGLFMLAPPGEGCNPYAGMENGLKGVLEHLLTLHYEFIDGKICWLYTAFHLRPHWLILKT